MSTGLKLHTRILGHYFIYIYILVGTRVLGWILNVFRKVNILAIILCVLVHEPNQKNIRIPSSTIYILMTCWFIVTVLGIMITVFIYRNFILRALHKNWMLIFTILLGYKSVDRSTCILYEGKSCFKKCFILQLGQKPTLVKSYKIIK